MEYGNIAGVILTVLTIAMLVYMGEKRDQCLKNLTRRPDKNARALLEKAQCLDWRYVRYIGQNTDEVHSPQLADAIGIYVQYRNDPDLLSHHLVDIPVEMYEHMPSFIAVVNRALFEQQADPTLIGNRI